MRRADSTIPACASLVFVVASIAALCGNSGDAFGFGHTPRIFSQRSSPQAGVAAAAYGGGGGAGQRQAPPRQRRQQRRPRSDDGYDDGQLPQEESTPEWAKAHPGLKHKGPAMWRPEARFKDAMSLSSFGRPVRAREQREQQTETQYDDESFDDGDYDDMMQPRAGDREQARNSWDSDRSVQKVARNRSPSRQVVPSTKPKTKSKAPKLTPATLTVQIGRQHKPKFLAELLSKAMSKFPLGAINIAAAFSKLADMRRLRPNGVVHDLELAYEEDRDCWGEVRMQIGRLLSRREVDARSMTTIFVAVANLRKKLPQLAEDLVPKLLDVVPEEVHAMNHVSTANLIWAMGVLELDSQEAVNVRQLLLQNVRADLHNFTMQDLAYISWGVTATGEGDSNVMNAIAERLRKQSAQMSTKSALMDLPYAACAFAKLEPWRRPLMEQVAFRLAPVLGRLKNWELAALTWAWEKQPGFALSETPSSDPFAREDLSRKPTLEEVFMKFGGALRFQANQRGVSQEDIERSPEGPDESWYSLNQQDTVDS